MIPDGQRLGGEGDGWKVALVTLMNERLAVGGGLSNSVMDVFKASQTQDYGDALAIEDHAVRDRLADWYCRESGLKFTSYRMITALSRGQDPGPEASISKVVVAANNNQSANFALDMQDYGGILDDDALSGFGNQFQRQFLRSPANRIEGARMRSSATSSPSAYWVCLRTCARTKTCPLRKSPRARAKALVSTPERAAWRATLDEALARYHALPRARGDAWAILEGKLATTLARQQAVEARLALADDTALHEDLIAVGARLSQDQKRRAEGRLSAEAFADLLAAQGERAPGGSSFDLRAGPAIDLKIEVNRDSPWPFERWRLTPEFAAYEMDGDRVFYPRPLAPTRRSAAAERQLRRQLRLQRPLGPQGLLPPFGDLRPPRARGTALPSGGGDL